MACGNRPPTFSIKAYVGPLRPSFPPTCHLATVRVDFSSEKSALTSFDCSVLRQRLEPARGWRAVGKSINRILDSAVVMEPGVGFRPAALSNSLVGT